jgi:DNA-binding GntR family transcriptional regulator
MPILKGHGMVTVLHNGPLHENVSEALRNLIVSGELVPGAKVREAQLCERFAISRTPLREALKVLAVEGLIELRPRRGAYIAKISDREIDELFPILAVLEALAGELACRRITDREIAGLRKLHEDMFRCYDLGREAEYLRLNSAIHHRIFEVAGNQSLTSLYEQMLVRTHAVRFVTRKSPEQWLRAVLDHRLILEAVEQRDGRKLARVLRQHLQKTAADIARASLA